MSGETAAELAVRLSEASVKKYWNPYADLAWPETVDRGGWFMSPELISIYGTELWSALSLEQQKSLSFFELVSFFSLSLHGERLLIQGLCRQMYARQGPAETEYLHHFLDEENKHMVMFSLFCRRYAGKVYPDKKIALPKEQAPDVEDLAFFIKTMVAEELGDVYNVEMMRDARIEPLAREVNRRHHEEEARHIAFSRRRCREMFAEAKSRWPEATLSGFRAWAGEYLRSSLADFYNPSMYRDAGLGNAYEVRTSALAHPVCAERRKRISAGLMDYFLETEILLEAPEL